MLQLLIISTLHITVKVTVTTATSTPTPTQCGFVPPMGGRCEDGCPIAVPAARGGYCAPSCGEPCTTSSQCGPYPSSACSLCLNGVCSGTAEFGNCTMFDSRPLQGGLHLSQVSSDERGRAKRPQPQQALKPPVLPSAWSAVVGTRNETDGTLGSGKFWYDTRFGALRQDFSRPCPLAQAQVSGCIDHAAVFHCREVLLPRISLIFRYL